jgi:hypothetical protein
MVFNLILLRSTLWILVCLFVRFLETMIYKALHRKLKIEQHEPHYLLYLTTTLCKNIELATYRLFATVRSWTIFLNSGHFFSIISSSTLQKTNNEHLSTSVTREAVITLPESTRVRLQFLEVFMVFNLSLLCRTLWILVCPVFRGVHGVQSYFTA